MSIIGRSLIWLMPHIRLKLVIIIQRIEKGEEKGMGDHEPKILHDLHGIHHSPCTAGRNLCMWEDNMYLISQSNDMDTSPGARLFNTLTTATQIASYKQLIKHMEHVVLEYILWVLARMHTW